MATLVKLLCLFSILFYQLANASTCFSQKNCESCVQETTYIPGVHCRWCLLDSQCHTYMSSLGKNANPCTESMNIKYRSGCDTGKDISTDYKKDLAYEQVFLAAAAYSDEPDVCLNELKGNHGSLPDDIEIIEIIASQCDDTIFDYKECLAIIGLSVSHKSIYVSFRGTTSITPQLVIEGLSILFEFKRKLGKGHVQKYFLVAFQNLPGIRERVMEAKKRHSDFKVYFSGHSLGGALASIAAFTFIHEGLLNTGEVSLYTYGMPRVGDKQYAFEFNSKVSESFRLVNHKDCITHFPTCFISCIAEGATGPYHHHTEVFYDTENMNQDSTPKICPSGEGAGCSHIYHRLFKTLINAGVCLKYHQTYFGIPVGDHCDNIMGKRRKRSDMSDINHLLSSDHSSVLQRGKDGWFVAFTFPINVAEANDTSTCNETCGNDTSTVSEPFPATVKYDNGASQAAPYALPLMIVIIYSLW